VDRTFEYGSEEDERITVQAFHVPIEVCDGCGESYSGPEAAKVEHEAICRILGLPTPSEIVGLRDRLGLSQAKFAHLTGIGEATISRWERGLMLPNRAMARYLHLLDHNPANVTLLRAEVSDLADSLHELPPGRNGSWRFELIIGLTQETEAAVEAK
jgi:HTH-type transcriptional regulator/antitoxin MqsA